MKRKITRVVLGPGQPTLEPSDYESIDERDGIIYCMSKPDRDGNVAIRAIRNWSEIYGIQMPAAKPELTELDDEPPSEPQESPKRKR
jgi:hypothetical protein